MHFRLDFSVNLPSMNELSQMFPKLDGDLSSVTNHFRFDNMTTENVDPSEAKTPLQATKQFASKSDEQAADEEDDERTLSTDYLTNQIESKSDGVVSAATKLLEDIINKSTPKQQTEVSTDASMRTFNFQFQKQTSLHGSQSTVSVASLRQTSNMATPDSFHRFPRRNFEYSRFMSVDQRSISDTEDNVAVDLSVMKNQDSNKTQSCANIKLSCNAPRSPGAIVVKEKYIELPKQRAHSIRTSSTGNDPLEHGESATRSVSLTSSAECVSKWPKSGSTKRRFTTTKVDESQLGTSVLKEV